MAGELQWSDEAGKTEYALIRDKLARVWDQRSGGAFVTYATADYSNYPVSTVEQGTASAYYAGTMPSAIPPGVYSVTGKRQAGGSPQETDPTVAQGDLQWNGSAPMPMSDLATSGQVGQFAPIRLARGQMIRKFAFKLVSSLDHVTPFVSGVVSGQISRDGLAFTALQSGAFTEVGLGWYTLQALTSGDLNCDTAALVFTGAGVSGGLSDQRDFGLVLQRTSGY